ncbi:MAG: ATP-binding cassette domain-containing protein [Thermodesulfobacteria bacterium]|nr:ATP-binding cassette domain-containing protein [Thermodesulfobacteriota bacterium]
MVSDYIAIKGARLHNLKNIDVSIPLGKITMITGRSGSGKSTLAVDILGKISSQKYLDILDNSGWGRKPLLLKEGEYVELVEPICPPVIMSADVSQRSAHSTVGSITGLGLLFRNIFRFAGRLVCPRCHEEVEALTLEEIVSRMEELAQGKRIAIMAPLDVPGNFEERERFFRRLHSQGYLRVEFKGDMFMLDDELDDLLGALDGKPGEVFLVIDRLKVDAGKGQRLFESARLALEVGDGRLCSAVYSKDGIKKYYFSTRLWCHSCNQALTGPEELEQTDNETESDEAVVLEASRVLMGREEDFFYTEEVRKLLEFFEGKFKGQEVEAHQAIGPLLDKILALLGSLVRLEVGYLNLDRGISSLSSGEFLKLRLAAVVAQRLSGVLYILDEPVSQLPLNERLQVCQLIRELSSPGNTIVMIEHAPEALEIADYIVEIGPGAGKDGGQVVFQGWKERYEMPPLDLSVSKGGVESRKICGDTITCTLSDYFSPGQVELCTKAMNLVLGPTGSGKSRLLQDIRQDFENRGHGASIFYVPEQSVFKSKYSIPATVLSIFGHIRRLFARTKQARGYGLSANMFSLAKRGGRCEMCKGTGQVEKEGVGYTIGYLCPVCKGLRYNGDILAIRYKGLNISEVLELTCSEAADFFANISAIRRPLETAERVGVGYIRLGQPLTSLSSGEAQRLKIASHLASNRREGAKIFILDQPSRGLHPRDVKELLNFLEELLRFEATIVLADNNPELLSLAHRVIRLDGRGPTGGKIVG